MAKTAQIPRRLPSQPLDRSVAYMDRYGRDIFQLELEFGGQLDADRLARAAVLALDAEPVLGCRFADHWWKPCWERLTPDTGSVLVTAHTESDFESLKPTSVDARTGPQIQVCVYNSPSKARLLIKVSHYVADAAGVKDVARLISSIYSTLGLHADFRPAPNVNGSRGAGQVLRTVPWRSRAVLFLRNLRENRATQARRGTLTLAFPEGPPESLSFIDRLLPRDHVSTIAEYGRKYGATINDSLLAAFLRALAATAGWDGHKELAATATIDLRRYMPDRQASAVTNLSTSILGWPSLGTDLGHDFPSTLRRVSSITGPRKREFVGVDVLLGSLLPLAALPNNWAARFTDLYFRQLIDGGNFPHFLTNMGPIQPSAVIFDSKPSAARLLPPPGYPPLFIVGVSGYEGTLTLSTGVFSHQRQLTDRFLDAMVAQLPR